MLVRFADDAAIMCKDRRQAEAALARYVALLAGLGLEPKAAKTRIVHLTADAEDGVDFLGFHHRLVTVTSRRTGRKFAFLARWPRNEKMQYARDRIRDITSRPRLRLPIGQIVTEMNAFLRGFVNGQFAVPAGGQVKVPTPRLIICWSGWFLLVLGPGACGRNRRL